MTTGINVALERFSRRTQPIIREHEVLRVAGWIPGDDPNLSKNAITEILNWAEKRSGGLFPPEAREFDTFEHISGGRNRSCVRFNSDEADIWAIRADDPDRSVAGRIWTTEVVVGRLLNEPPKFSARLLVSTPESDLQIEPATPGCVLQVVEKCNLVSGKLPLSILPLYFLSVNDVDEIIEHLVDPDRELPTFVVTLTKEGQLDHPTINTKILSRALLGIAHVALLGHETSKVFVNRIGKLRSVFGGAARVYLPGFNTDSDPYSHRLVLANQIETIEGAERCSRWMRQLAAQQSVLRTKLGREVLSFAAIKNASFEQRQQKLRIEDASTDVQFEAAIERIEEFKKQIASQASEQDYYIAEYEKERTRAEIAETQAQRSAYRIQQLTDQLKAKGDDPDHDLVSPGSWSEFSDWCDANFAGRLVLTPNAYRGLRSPNYQDIETAANCVKWLATDCRDQRINGGSGSINNLNVMEGIINAACGTDTYDFDWNGRKFSAEWHIKNGGNTRDPGRCLRIYYCFDPQTQQIIVSDMPAHRRSSAS